MTEVDHVEGTMAAIEEADSARVTLTISVILKAVEKNCILMIDYGVATVGGIVDSYLTDNKCLSAALSIAIAVVTFFVGKHMMKEVTKERLILPEGGAPPEPCPPEPCRFCKWLQKTLSAIGVWLSGTLSAIGVWLNP